GTDTGSGHYTEYPRTVSDGGVVSFGTSPVVTSVDLPKGSNGQVILSLESKQSAPSGKETYLIFDLSVSTYPSGESADISFRIKQAELTAKGFSAADVCLYHYVEGNWVSLSTEYYIGSDGYVYYTAKTTGFGPFAIVFEEGAAVQSKNAPITPTEPAVTVPSTLEPVQSTETLAPVESATAVPTAKSPAPLAGLAIGLGAAALLIRRQNN
ncbi:MAG: PGF-pre-PGF domain-containing protein, partial [Methanocorpusculum sp.]|nr:PGF-pre-PGF domain-containing protein [Methanocorpusculum sp.]